MLDHTSVSGCCSASALTGIRKPVINRALGENHGASTSWLSGGRSGGMVQPSVCETRGYRCQVFLFAVAVTGLHLIGCASMPNRPPERREL